MVYWLKLVIQVTVVKIVDTLLRVKLGWSLICFLTRDA